MARRVSPQHVPVPSSKCQRNPQNQLRACALTSCAFLLRRGLFRMLERTNANTTETVTESQAYLFDMGILGCLCRSSHRMRSSSGEARAHLLKTVQLLYSCGISIHGTCTAPILHGLQTPINLFVSSQPCLGQDTTINQRLQRLGVQQVRPQLIERGDTQQLHRRLYLVPNNYHPPPKTESINSFYPCPNRSSTIRNSLSIAFSTPGVSHPSAYTNGRPIPTAFAPRHKALTMSVPRRTPPST
ncbi:hypothetical protein AG1IA_00277 [Rhizoctonia solani AG-1 IA]|uniref:Uncharacterized protein n=1 Tax=Thanatephorus cucumeris (strain AG1-IA) TaxID=983506 RepID=L8X9B0_THACA|nr:hypothetical protein AG1IA_00277 [Rhizoctonia solani AG-1 IA]